MVPPILLKIRWNGAGLSVLSVIVHARLLLVKIRYSVPVSVAPAVELIVYSLFIPTSPLTVASLSARTCAPICAYWARAYDSKAGSELASGVTGVDSQNALALVVNPYGDRTADARSAAKMACCWLSSFSAAFMTLLLTPLSLKRLSDWLTLTLARLTAAQLSGTANHTP